MKISFPPHVIIKLIREWCVVYFKDKDFDTDAPGHHYIVIPTSCGNLTLCIVTSKVTMLTQYYDHNARTSLVKLNPGDFSFINRPSVIDCNRAELFTREELLSRATGFRKTQETISDSLKKQVIAAIQNSRRVQAYIQDSLPDLQ